jgi:hypothetical protein
MEKKNVFVYNSQEEKTAAVLFAISFDLFFFLSFFFTDIKVIESRPANWRKKTDTINLNLCFVQF